jgi:hypothetical protein
MSQCAKFAGKQIADCTRGEFCICLNEMKSAVQDSIDAARWRKFKVMPEADQKACLCKAIDQCVDDYEATK